MTNPEIKIGYIITSSTQKGLLGAILICDEKGFPLEFQYTDPILPTQLQKILYGNSLEKYLKVDVIMDNLLEVISNKIDLLIVQDEQLLEYQKNKFDLVRAVGTSITQNDRNEQAEKIKNNEYVIEYSKTISPVRITFTQAVETTDELFQKVFQIIKQAGQYIDITEPLERIQKSIDVIITKENE